LTFTLSKYNGLKKRRKIRDVLAIKILDTQLRIDCHGIKAEVKSETE
jgi:hypothetical protein